MESSAHLIALLSMALNFGESINKTDNKMNNL